MEDLMKKTNTEFAKIFGQGTNGERVVICHHCDKPAELITGAQLYVKRPDLAHLRFWRCKPCGAYVGCHKNGDHQTPLGRLANAMERSWRKVAHANFDPIWQSGRMGRSEAYKWLADLMGIKAAHCHISWFGVDECKKVYEICKTQQPPIGGDNGQKGEDASRREVRADAAVQTERRGQSTEG